MKYNFDKIVPRRGTNCFKHDACREVFGSDEVLPLWVADMDFEVAPCVTKALERRMSHPVYGYEKRSEGYFRAIIDWVGRRNGWKIDRSWINFTPGVVSGFVFAIRALSKPGGGVVIQPPVYPPFASSVRANGRALIENPLVETPDGYRIDFEDLDRKLAGARLLLFCNPHNPTGRVLTREELIRVGELCCKHNVLIISDEIHSDLVQRPYRHTHIASLGPELAERTVTLIAPSKTFNLAGLSTSLAITPGDTLRRMLCTELDSVHVGQGNAFGNAALEAAYAEGEDWLEELLEYIGGNMDYVLGFIKEHIPRIKGHRSESTYMLWLDMRGLGMEHEKLVQFLIEKAGLGLNDGASFGGQGRGFMRINLATSRTVIEQAMERLKTALSAVLVG